MESGHQSPYVQVSMSAYYRNNFNCFSSLNYLEPFIYHKGKQLKKGSTVYIEEDSQELVECRVLPQLPKNTKISWTNQKREVINGTWNETGYQLTVSSKDTFPAEYYCNVKVTIDGNEKSFPTSVRFEGKYFYMSKKNAFTIFPPSY